MEKNILLEKFKKENEAGDERSVYLRERCYAYTFRATLITCLALMVMEELADIVLPLEVRIVFVFIIGVHSFFSIIWTKSKFSLFILIFAILALVGFIFYSYTGTYIGNMY